MRVSAMRLSTFHTRNTTRHTGISGTENLLQNLSLQRPDIVFIVSTSLTL